MLNSVLFPTCPETCNREVSPGSVFQAYPQIIKTKHRFVVGLSGLAVA